MRKDPNNKNWPAKKTVFTCTLIIMSISFALLFYFQDRTEIEIKESIFEQQQKNQIDKTKAIAENVESTLNLITAKLEGLSTSKVLQQGNFQAATTAEILNDRFEQINDIAPIDRPFLIDKNGTSKMNAVKRAFHRSLGLIFTILNGIANQKIPYLLYFQIHTLGWMVKHKFGLTHIKR